jgi:heat shock protein HslJ
VDRKSESRLVERFVSVRPRETCGNPLVDAPLRGTYWKLVRLGDAPASVSAKQREAHLVFSADALRVAGSDGCNRVMGSFELDGDRLRFGAMAATRMACQDNVEQQQRFHEVVQQVERYRIQGSHLEFLDGNGVVRAGFEAVALQQDRAAGRPSPSRAGIIQVWR